MAQVVALLFNSGGICGGLVWRRSPVVVCERFEVLHDGREMELVACAGEASQAHAFEAVVGLQVREAHFDSLPLIA
jgi:hypothetical protein